MKEAIFVGTSKQDIRSFPSEAMHQAGLQLMKVQYGFDPNSWKPMTKTVGTGVREIRIQTGGQFLVIYVATIGEAVYVLHAFQKKSQKTPDKELKIARKRLKEVRAR